MWLYLQKADDNPAKATVLSTLESLLIQQGVNVGMMGNQQVANSASNIAMAQAMEGGANQLQTRKDVLPAQ
jgi:hypothetical protein